MASNFASAKHSIAECDICGQRYKLKQLKPLTVKTKITNILACPECWNPDQPQLQLGMYPVNDPQAVRNPRPDVSYQVSGQNGLQIVNNDTNAQDAFGNPEGGSRVFQWNWYPVGGARDNGLTPNDLVSQGQVGTVTIT
jgi:hypothetical protein